VRAERLIPVFPSKTYPTHYTVVTGLRAEHHGIVANTIFDPELDAWFRLSDRSAVGDRRWWGGEPIWATAERQGLSAGILFWPGSEAAIGGRRPSAWRPYDHDLPAADKIAAVSGWLSPGPQRKDFVATYFHDIDTAAHQFEPGSPELAAAVAAIDTTLGELLAALEPLGGLDAINVIVVSDHGMAPLAPERVILLDHLVPDWDDRWVVDWGPLLALRPPSEREDEISRALRSDPHLTVWRRGEVPDRFHYRNHPRISPLLALAAEGWTITTSERLEADPDLARGGNHGYDPFLPSMGAFFVAAGPSFRRGLEVPPFESVHLYELFCRLLHIQPATNDGDPRALEQILQP
jgi:predicted AlkP superfamily pyrophosphatase or phosphodiesterase